MKFDFVFCLFDYASEHHIALYVLIYYYIFNYNVRLNNI